MSVIIAEIDSRVLSDLDLPSEWLSIDAVHNAVVQRLNVRTMQERFGNANTLLSKSTEFTPTVLQTDITSLVSKGVPAFVEYQVNEVFTPMRVVNLAELDDYYRASRMACAFWAEDTVTVGSEAVQYLQFSILPVTPCRIRYDRDAVKLRMSDKIPSLDSLAELIVLEAENSLIPRANTKIAMNFIRNEQERKDGQLIVSLLNGIYEQNVLDMKPLIRLWEVAVWGERGTETDFDRLVPSGRSLYSDSNRW